MSSRATALAPSMADLTAGLVRIDLDLLVDRAALLTRVDRKYVVPTALLAHLVAGLPEDACVLEVAGRRTSAYHSLYLDTPERDSYLLAGRKRRGRWKIRTRSYLDTGASFLELKTSGPRGSTVKERIELPGHRAGDDVGPLGRTWVAGRLGAPVAGRLAPALATRYRRSTLFLPGSGARATVDEDLRFEGATGPRAPGGSLGMPGRVIVETKSGARPSEVDRLLWRSGLRPVAISKYGVGLAALDPSLPRLKWHRTLARHLDRVPDRVTLDPVPDRVTLDPANGPVLPGGRTRSGPD
ncbi:polyphosphate polymerase domain-containing protein [Nocardioides sambongensis]|uniref:polyphosphate polymerase domain-containing protein n=1 Tax=Nocardioides sambongensis TaxID=2589074 RepID=UPI0018C8B314|nr:polyphosphate polymerase domain-containing protein [Nocardioides sambongensis]